MDNTELNKLLTMLGNKIYELDDHIRKDLRAIYCILGNILQEMENTKDGQQDK